MRDVAGEAVEIRERGALGRPRRRRRRPRGRGPRRGGAGRAAATPPARRRRHLGAARRAPRRGRRTAAVGRRRPASPGPTAVPAPPRPRPVAGRRRRVAARRRRASGSARTWPVPAGGATSARSTSPRCCCRGWRGTSAPTSTGLAPERIEVPSGNRHRVDYDDRPAGAGGEAAGDVRRHRDARRSPAGGSPSCSTCSPPPAGRCRSPRTWPASGTAPTPRCGPTCGAATPSTRGPRTPPRPRRPPVRAGGVIGRASGTQRLPEAVRRGCQKCGGAGTLAWSPWISTMPLASNWSRSDSSSATGASRPSTRCATSPTGRTSRTRTCRQIERGLHTPSVRVLKAIAAALNVSAESLLVQAGLLEASDGNDARAPQRRGRRRAPTPRSPTTRRRRSWPCTAATSRRTRPSDEGRRKRARAAPRRRPSSHSMGRTRQAATSWPSWWSSSWASGPHG